MQGRRPPNAEAGSGSIRVVNERLRRQLIEQRLSLLQIARIKPFGEPAVDRSDKLAGFSALARFRVWGDEALASNVSGAFIGDFARIRQRTGYRLGKGGRDCKDKRLSCHDETGVLSVLPRVPWSSFCASTSDAGLLSAATFSFIVSGTTGDEAAFSTGLDSELSEFGGPISSSAAGDVNSSLKASCAQAVAIWRNAKRAALSRLSTAHRLQSPDNLQQSSANDVITPMRAL